MLVVLIIFSLGMLGFIIFSAISPKSSGKLRLAAIIALGAICLAIIVCGIIIMIGPAEEDPMAVPMPTFPDSPPRVEERSRFTDIIFLAIFLVVIGLIIAKATMDQRKISLAEKNAAAAKPDTFRHGGEMADLEQQEPDRGAYDFDLGDLDDF